MSAERRGFCAVCGSKNVMAILFGRPYCFSCASKVVRLNLIRFLGNLKREGLIPSHVELPAP